MTDIVEIVQRRDEKLAMIRKSILICLSMCLAILVSAQQHRLTLEVVKDDTKQSNELAIDSERVKHYTDSLVAEWKSDGYLNAEVDNILSDSLHSKATIYQGYRYHTLQLDLDPQTSNLLQEAGMANVRWIGDTYSHQRVRDAMDKILIYLENHGQEI